MKPEAIIEISGLTKRYGEFKAVDHLDLFIEKGEVFGLLGPNGAGKSTTILMLMGLTEPDEGSIRVCGINPVIQPVEVKRKVGYLPEDVGFYDKYTGLENLLFTAYLNGLSTADALRKATELLQIVGLASHQDKKTGTYSRGMRQRLGLADVLIKNPEVIILDEPIMGIDPSGVKEFLDLIVRLSKQEGITVLFSSHQLYQIQQVCDRVGLFVSGKLIASGTMESLSRKLSGDTPFSIEIGVDLPDKNKAKSAGDIRKILSTVDGIQDVRYESNRFYAGSDRDLTSELATALINKGYRLSHLSRKEYGLDDIYYRYFEGGGVQHG